MQEEVFRKEQLEAKKHQQELLHKERTTLFRWTIFIILCVLLITGITFFIYQKYKLERERTQQVALKKEEKIERARLESEKIQKEIYKIQKEIELEQIKVGRKKAELEEYEKDIAQIHLKKKKKKNEMVDLECLEEDVKKKKEEIKRAEEEIERKREQFRKINPYRNEQGYYVKLNRNGYEVFKDTEKVFHRYWALKQIFEPHKDWFQKHYGSNNFDNYEVHHIDSNQLNNNENNLAIIPCSLHRKIKHWKISRGNRQAGLTQLRKVGIKQPHLEDF